MADLDITPFGKHDKTDEHPDETIPLTLGRVIGRAKVGWFKDETLGQEGHRFHHT